MERAGEDIFALDESGMVIVRGEDFDVGTYGFDDRATNEDHFEGFGFEFCFAEENVAGELPAIGVAENGDVEKAERGLLRIFDVLREEDGASASAEDRFAAGGELADGVLKAFFFEELELRGAFAAGKDQAGALFELRDGADFDGVGAEFAEAGGVGFEVSLDGEDADFHDGLL
jgi:hypothetical protein